MTSKYIKATVVGLLIGTLGGLIGLGGAEFRLPLLVGYFGLSSIEAVMINKITSLVVVSWSLPARAQSIAWSEVFSHWKIILNILSGSLVGAWIGANVAVKIKALHLDRMIMFLLVALAVSMIFGHDHITSQSHIEISLDTLHIVTGTLAGIGIGLVAAILGVAGGELIIPTLVLLYGVDIKLAGSLSLCISLPTMAIAFVRYSQSGAIPLLKREARFIGAMAIGSVIGTIVGGALVGKVHSGTLLTIMGCILLISAFKTFLHSRSTNKD